MTAISRAARPDVTAVVLAGGFGTRIRHLLAEIPKPMAPVAGRPFLEHVAHFLARLGIRRIVLSTGYRAEVIAAHFECVECEAEITCVVEPESLGTGGGFLHAARVQAAAPEAWLVLNGDSLVFADIERFIGAFAAGGWDAAVLGLRVADAARFGTLEVAADGALRRFAEKNPGAGLINAGVYLFRHASLAAFPPGRRLSFETEVFPALIARGSRILVYPVEAPFLDIGTPESLAEAEAFIQGNRSWVGLPVPPEK